MTAKEILEIIHNKTIVKGDTIGGENTTEQLELYFSDGSMLTIGAISDWNRRIEYLWFEFQDALELSPSEHDAK